MSTPAPSTSGSASSDEGSTAEASVIRVDAVGVPVGPEGCDGDRLPEELSFAEVSPELRYVLDPPPDGLTATSSTAVRGPRCSEGSPLLTGFRSG